MRMDEQPPNNEQLPEHLAALDARVGEVLRERLLRDASPIVVERIVAASRASTVTPINPRMPLFGPRFRAAASLLVVASVALGAWFALRSTPGMTPSPAPRSLAINFERELGVASAEEAILVAILDGDGAWTDQASFNRPGALEAEPVVRTRGTNVDDLANEIMLILGTTS